MQPDDRPTSTFKNLSKIVTRTDRRKDGLSATAVPGGAASTRSSGAETKLHVRSGDLAEARTSLPQSTVAVENRRIVAMLGLKHQKRAKSA